MAKTDKNIILGASALGKRGEQPFETGSKAAQELLNTLNSESTVDNHIQDQIIILMALAKGRSRVKVAEATLHTKTAIYVVEQLMNVSFTFNL